MARDHALADVLPPNEGVLRLYRWDPPTISFGRNEPARGIYDEEEGVRRGVGFVRRPTGGRAVLHHQELTYALVVPVAEVGGLRRTYRLINRGLLAGLQRLGAGATLAPASGPALPPDSGPCFRAPAEGEVTALGRKLIGSAQVKLGETILQHGSLILDGDQDLLRTLRGDREPVPASATLRSLLGGLPSVDRLGLAIQEGLAHTLGGTWESGSYRKAELDAAGKWEEHYRDREWTWRL
jgi:lipoate-protein ligase A